MLPRVLEPEVMDTPEEARDYDAMDHAAVNRLFAADFLAAFAGRTGTLLDVGTGTALIPVELCRRHPTLRVHAVDLSAEMLKLAARNVSDSGLSERITLERVDGKRMPDPDGRFDAAVSNSIVHHIPEPRLALADLHRVCAHGGLVFVRDLLRPDSDAEVRRLVALHAADANEHQRALFDASLRAAHTLAEVRAIAVELGYPADSVMQTSDRHWTWSATRP